MLSSCRADLALSRKSEKSSDTSYFNSKQQQHPLIKGINIFGIAKHQIEHAELHADFEEILDKACKKYNAVILDSTNKSKVVQITALRREIDTMAKNLRKFGLVSVSRTGAVAMTRGEKVFK